MTTVYLYDDARARTFEPFASTRPVSEMVAGTALIRERWKAALGANDTQFIAGPRHADFDEPGARAATGMLPRGLDHRQRAMRSRRSPTDPAKAERSARDVQPVAQRRPARGGSRRASQSTSSAFADGSLTLDELHAGTGAIGNIGGWWLDEVWDFIRLLPEQLTADIARLIERDRP